jgi:hypothetical protein
MRAIINWKYFKKIKWKKFPKSTLSASIHSTVYRRPTKCRKWASKNTKYGQPWDIRGRRLKAPPDWHFLLAIFTVLLSLAYWPSYWWLKYEKSFLPTFCCFWPSSPPPRTPIGEQWRKGRIVQLPTPLFLFRASERCWNEWTTKVSSKTTVLIT